MCSNINTGETCSQGSNVDAKHLTQRMHTQCSKSYSPSPFIGQYKYWWGRCLPCQTNDALRHRPVQWRAPVGRDQSEPGSRGESEPVIVLLETTALRQRAKQQQLLPKRSNKTVFDTKSWIHSHCTEAISNSLRYVYSLTLYSCSRLAKFPNNVWTVWAAS